MTESSGNKGVFPKLSPKPTPQLIKPWALDYEG